MGIRLQHVDQGAIREKYAVFVIKEFPLLHGWASENAIGWYDHDGGWHPMLNQYGQAEDPGLWEQYKAEKTLAEMKAMP